jgi:transglutaminase-like putative cysteine protease
MLYDVRLQLHYDYDANVRNDRHLIRVTPVTLPGQQRVIATALTFEPRPSDETHFTDFFGNRVTVISYAEGHDELDVRLAARISVEPVALTADLSPDLAVLADELARLRSVDPESPHHFLGPSPRLPVDAAITAYAEKSTGDATSVFAIARALCTAIHRDFAYDSTATGVDTPAGEAFALRKGVCQDFAHVMITGLRGLGIPAAYVSGFLRTIPPEGEDRLEGADAMHAWVRVWCGATMGWVAFDPTNDMLAGADHITIGHGRDYADISPIVGVLRTTGDHRTEQAVDVVVVD